eukprot:5104820-Amphidinium_carterae.1
MGNAGKSAMGPAPRSLGEDWLCGRTGEEAGRTRLRQSILAEPPNSINPLMTRNKTPDSNPVTGEHIPQNAVKRVFT